MKLELRAITLDCAKPRELAEFYQRATGWGLHPKSNADFAGVLGPAGLMLGFQRVEDYRAPSWPDQSSPQQSHLDFAVDDIAAAAAELVELGATRPFHQPNPDRWLVLLDPAGHPFCLTGT